MPEQSHGAAPPLLVRDRLAVTLTFALLAAAVASWIASYYMMINSNSSMGVAAIVSSLSISSVSSFEVAWIIGMIAMMFPAMIPFVLFYDRIVTQLSPNPHRARVVGTPLFLAGYLVMYALLGLSVYIILYGVLESGSIFASMSSFSVILAGAILMITGLYQFSPLKGRCLSQCISPIRFFSMHSQKSELGSFRLGIDHGLYCVGCCWAYMLVMLAVGAMSITIMLALAGIIALEKVIVRGSVWFNRAVAVGFIGVGILVILLPGTLMLL